MAFPFAEVIMGGAKLASGILKSKAQKKAAKEQFKKEEQNLQSRFESEQALEGNREDDRLARMGFIGSQLQGARALSPEVLRAALTRRRGVARKGVAVDKSKGMGFGMLGDIAGGVGDVAAAYIKGKQMGDDGSAATSLRPEIGGSSSFDPRIGGELFRRGNCPPGEIC